MVLESEGLSLPGNVWLDVVRMEQLPMLAKFAHSLASAKRDARLHSPPLRLSLKLLCKTILQYLTPLEQQPAFPALWSDLLQLFQVTTYLSLSTFSLHGHPPCPSLPIL